MIIGNLYVHKFLGVSVNSGRLNGLKVKFENHFNKKIPYIHCFSHRLYLIVLEIIKNQRDCHEYFDVISELHNFFKKYKVRSIYEGDMIPLIIEQRWSSHSRAAKAIKNNYPMLCEALDIAHESNVVDSKDQYIAGGLLKKINKPVFKFLVGFISDLLDEIEPVNKLLQSREFGYVAAVPLIESCVANLKNMRSEEKFSQYREAGEALNPNYEEPTQVFIV